jgi:hypothetical protein
MKINTKNCSPMAGAPQEAIIRPNKYIRPSTTSEEGDLHAGFFHPTTPNGKKTATTAPGAPKKKKQPKADAVAASGRHVMFLPTIVYTPVQTSARHHKDDSSSSSTASSSNNKNNNNNNTDNIHNPTSSQTAAARRLLSADDVDALNQRLEQLIIGHKEDEEEAKQDYSSKTFGRVETTAFSYKTSSNSQVLRSARFQK